MKRYRELFEQGEGSMAAGKRRLRRSLRLNALCVRRMEHRLRRLKMLDSDDETMHRLKQDAGNLLACLREAKEVRSVPLPTLQGRTRVLTLAREMLSGGERRLEKEEMIKEINAIEELWSPEMEELQRLPDALRIALCEALADLFDEAIRDARARERARIWVEDNGRRKLNARDDAVFSAYALKLAAEQEKPELHAKLEMHARRRGERIETLAEYMHRRDAERCLCLENLLHAHRLLDAMDQEAFFSRVSMADAELKEDPAQIYGRMDEASLGMARREAARLAKELCMEETTLARHAISAAQAALEQWGADDPRATVCWYILEDAGRAELQRRVGGNGRISRRIPDETGRITLLIIALCTMAVLLLLLAGIKEPLLMIFTPPLAWVLSLRLIGRAYSRWVRPLSLPKLKLERIPEHARTLVVLPVLLSSEARACEMTAHMGELGCLETDENIDFLLLGDFQDADDERMSEDEEILAAARAGVRALNERTNRKKYYYLHRQRSLRMPDGRWMGERRKRGALTALNQLLLSRPEAERAFGAEGSCASELAGRYRYVVTLDADTEYLPDTLHRLLGAMLHPLNRSCVLDGKRRGFAVLQPNMHLMPETDVNAYVHTAFGSGGVDGYPVSVSDFYQDMTGHGNFSGKGIYDVRAFSEATEGVLNDDVILSHDLIEGILSGAALLNDVSFYEGCPDSPTGELRRLHRWTRGDWQLLPTLFSKLKLTALDRMKLLSNLLRSLYAPALAGLLIHSLWLDAPEAFAVGLLLAFQEPILQLPRVEKRMWKGALVRLALLPAEAGYVLDAILRTIWRLAVSRKHLMEWVPAADAGQKGSELRRYGRIGALLVLPGLLRPYWIPAAAALAALFLLGADWAEDLVCSSVEERSQLNEDQRALLEEIAGRTWHFFERYVPEEGCGLPPDNVQLDPPVGTAMRTSPTNIGLYLMSCLAAREMGFIDDESLLVRMENCLATLERLEKWHGQFYNWYDIDRLRPMRPRYVSAVDSGNLAAALLLCAHALTQEDANLAARFANLAKDMQLCALYDGERKLFFIGMDVESGRMSEAHYDLYASEARILSYAAMMLGQVPAQHWKRLSRAGVRVNGQRALISWSGTMFEYLMPELLLRSYPHTLAGESRRAVVACQMTCGRIMKRPWGVSESGYYAFDLHLNYQYRAFGLRTLAMSGNVAQDVVAPYASALALCEASDAAAENLRRMWELGWYTDMGLYEAADYTHIDGSGEARLVRSHMAHHQGMILCAICNALKSDVLVRSFMQIPEARALRLLLQEKTMPAGAGGRKGEKPLRTVRVLRQTELSRRVRRDGRAAEVHLLHGAGVTALLTARGGAFVWKREMQLNRFSGDLRSPFEGMYVHVEDAETGEEKVIGETGEVVFDAGFACFREEIGPLKLCMRVSISPEDGAFYQRLEIENTSAEERRLCLSGCMAVALADAADLRAHPVFQNMFVQSEWARDCALVFSRRARETGEEGEKMIYLLSGAEEIEYESDMAKLTGRVGALGWSDGISHAFSGSTGCVLDPCGALRVRLKLAGGEKKTLHFVLGLAKEENWEACIDNWRNVEASERAIRLAATQARAVLSHAGIEPERYRLLDRGAALLLDAKLRRQTAESALSCEPVPKNLLWHVGISGEKPILLVEFDGEAGLEGVREALHMHGFYHMLGVQTELALIDRCGSDYRRSIREAIEDMLSSSHIGSRRGVSGGAYILERRELEEEVYRALLRYAAFRLDGGEPVGIQLRTALEALRLRTGEKWTPMQPVGANMPEETEFFNGFGGFNGGSYAIQVDVQKLPPAPWCNVLSDENAGAVVSERGGGFAWRGSSRNDRITAFANNALREGWGWMFYLIDEGTRRWIRLLPGDRPMTGFIVRHAPGESRWSAQADALSFEVRMHSHSNGVQFEIVIRNGSSGTKHLRLAGLVDWLMGTDEKDAGALRTWSRFGAAFASGAATGVGCFAADDPQARTGCDRATFFSGGDMMEPMGLDEMDLPRGGWTLKLDMNLKAGELRRCRFLLGCADDVASAYALAREFRSGGALRRSREDWKEKIDRLRIETPDKALNWMTGGFLQAQTLNARIRARTGLYQPGGAFGFRDQLQDMLPMIYYEPERVRRHLLYCAARQFEDGDVLHWWHGQCEGVRTKISDDMLFLPYVTAQYVRVTGDTGVLADCAPFLEAREIPEGAKEIYAPMRFTAHCESLHEHCMRAFRRANHTGEHGLCLMGTGDWNDGMNRVGAQGRGESVWLSQFLSACARDYAEISPCAQDRAWLEEMSRRFGSAVEEYGWDGEWYLRAYADDGERLGGREAKCCRIDLISQAWAVLAGLDAARRASALNAAWERLCDERLGLVRLLDPPFDGKDFDPGYIAAYPAGVRENGAQYTHAACWFLCALAKQGEEQRAHRLLKLLLPVNHALDSEAVRRYRVEPYVMAADIYTHPEIAGRGGWTWYTGSAAWMLMAILELLGFERRGNRARLNALLGDWPEASVTLNWGRSRYRLSCRRDVREATLDGEPLQGEFVLLNDDGRAHSAVFPPRQGVKSRGD